MNRILISTLVAVALSGQAVSAAPGAPSAYPIGASIPVVEFVDDGGVVRSTAEWAGVPTILAPIFTRCPLACPMITQGLIDAALESDARPGTYRVVLFSFDPRDTPEVLRSFRQRRNIPLAWTLATAKPEDVRKLLDSVGYAFGSAGDAFTHPNLVIALTPDLKAAKFLLGTQYDLDEALAVARGKSDWVGRYGALLLAFLILLCTFSAVYLLILVRARKPHTEPRPQHT